MNDRLKISIRAVVGILLTFAFLLFFSSTRFVEVNRLQKSPDELAAIAESCFKSASLGEYSLNRRTLARVNEDLQHYAQKYLPDVSKPAELPLTRWDFTWRGEVETSEDKEENAVFYVMLDARGKLQEYHVNSPLPADTTVLDDDEAMAVVFDFLNQTGVDTTRLVQIDKTVNREAGIVRCGFKYEQASAVSDELLEKISVDMVGATVTKFEREIDVNKEAFSFPDYEEVGEGVVIGGMVVMWILIGVNLIIAFFRRLRRDEIDFKRAKKIAVVFSTLFIITMSFIFWGDWGEMSAALVFGGLAIGVMTLLLFGVVDAVLRERWPEKLLVFDLVFRGHFRVREVGKSMLDVVFLLGLSLSLLGAALWIAEVTNLGYINLDSDALIGLQSPFTFFGQLFSKGLQTFFVGLTALAFWPAILRRRIKRLWLFRLLLTLSLLFAGMSLILIRPFVWGLLFLPILCLLWAEIVRRYDLMTILCTLALTYIATDVAVFSLLPEGAAGTSTIMTVLSLGGFVGLGFFFYLSPKKARDIGQYIPEYVNRIAEQQRMQKELEIARRIQLQFLPQREPDVPGLEIASICIPAMEVGGDYFDFFYEDNRYLSVIVGDVSGKGVSAAFFMTMAKGIIKTVAKKIRAPKLALSEMNTVFYENSPPEVFISAIYGLFDMKAGKLTFARAGHNPLVVKKSLTGKAEFLNPRGLAVGLDSGGVFSKTIEESALQLEPGDVFLFYTDGLSEAMDAAGEEFGEDRLTETVNSNSTLSAKALLEKIKIDVDRFAGNAQQHDDFTMVVVKISDTTFGTNETTESERVAVDKPAAF